MTDVPVLHTPEELFENPDQPNAKKLLDNQRSYYEKLMVEHGKDQLEATRDAFRRIDALVYPDQLGKVPSEAQKRMLLDLMRLSNLLISGKVGEYGKAEETTVYAVNVVTIATIANLINSFR